MKKSLKYKKDLIKKLSKKINKYKRPKKYKTRKHRVFLKNLTHKLGNTKRRLKKVNRSYS
tara:strand:- start:2023 stop:2202 length:180 start_codon:yes stop_codon:yes gene_type:complete